MIYSTKKKKSGTFKRNDLDLKATSSKKRQELVKPIQDKVYNAVQKLAVARQYDLILDKSEGITVIFADPKLDRSDDVLKELTSK